MAGILLNHIRKSASLYVTKGGFEETISISTPPNATIPVSIETTGLASKHWINYDENGVPIDTKNAHVCVSESEMLEKGLIVRNSNEEVYMIGYRISVRDSSNQLKEYVVTQQHPNETLGLIVLILGDYNDGNNGGLQGSLQNSL